MPLLLNDAAVVSKGKSPTRRAGAVSPGIATPVSYPKMSVLLASPTTVPTETAFAFGLPQSKVLDVVTTVAVADKPAASG